MANDLSVTMTVGQLEVTFTSEGTSYSPDVALDLIRRTGEAFTTALIAVQTMGLNPLSHTIVVDGDDDEDD